MINFTFQNKTKIIFGKNTEEQIGSEVKNFSSNILLHYGRDSIKKIGLYDKVIKSLKAQNITIHELPGAQPNPRLSLVNKGIDMCRKHNIDFILAVGGGSVIDSAKGIAAGVKYKKAVWDLYINKDTAVEALPIGVILTIPAAGSETSMGSVVTNEDGDYKRYINYEFLRPKFAILNPETTYTLPPYQTACGAADIMAHIMERYFTNVTNVGLTDRLCEAALKTIILNVPIALNNPEDYNARAEIMWTGTIAHNDLLGTGRIGDWSSHDIEHELSGIYDIAHGAGLSIVFPAWMKYVYKENINRFAQFASRVWNIEYSFSNPEITALKGIEQLEFFFKSIDLPTRLSEADIPDTRLEEMAEKSLEGRKSLGNLRKLISRNVLEILRIAK